MDEMILTYVPESEHLSFDEAHVLAEERDEQAADAFMQSVPDSEKLPVLVTYMMEKHPLPAHYLHIPDSWKADAA